MKLLAWLILGILARSHLAQVTDFCPDAATICAGMLSTNHIHCVQTTEQYSLACPGTTTMLNLAPVRTRILNEFNTLRNRVASGNEIPFFAATGMGTMAWNVTLANLARRNVKRCIFGHDECRSTPEIPYAGQTIARVVEPQTSTRLNIDVIIDAINTWFNEGKNAVMAHIRSFPAGGVGTNDKIISNFAQVVRDFATRVGCACLKHPEGAYYVYLFTCNYDLINFVGGRVYRDGSRTGRCTTGPNPNYPYLCSTAETYNVVDPASDPHW